MFLRKGSISCGSLGDTVSKIWGVSVNLGLNVASAVCGP